MKPHVYFSILSIGLISIVTLSISLVSYLMSLVFMWFRIQTAQTPAYGARANFATMIGDFPWLIILCIVALLALVTVIVRRYGTAYKVKVSVLIAAVLSIGLVLGGLFYLVSAQHTGIPGTGQNDTNRGRGLQNQVR